MVKVSDITGLLAREIPLAYQESYDNSGLQLGDAGMETDSAILTLDITEEVIDEAIKEGSSLIISHHPLIFAGLKRITGKSRVERIVIKALRNNVSIYSAHTNLDVIPGGVSYRMAQKVGLLNTIPLAPLKDKMVKIVVFVPGSHAEMVRKSMFEAGAGHIGNYDHCSFNSEGFGTFRPGDKTKPFAGERGTDHNEPEVRIETVVPIHLSEDVVRALEEAHPYEEVAYDIYNIANDLPGAGMGVIGDLPQPVGADRFLEMVATEFNLQSLRYSQPLVKRISRIAMCGGSGSSLAGEARRAGADAFITGDIRYHTFFDEADDMMLVDIGHFESEKFSLEILYEIITKKFPKFAVRFSKINTNPVNYLPTWKK